MAIFGRKDATDITIGIHLDRSATSLLHDLLPSRIQLGEQLLPFISFQHVMILRAMHVMQRAVKFERPLVRFF